MDLLRTHQGTQLEGGGVHFKPLRRNAAIRSPTPFEPQNTGMASHALACHPKYAHSAEARGAGELLASRFLQPDAYNSYNTADNWVRFQYPYWWNNLVMALDSMSRIGFTTDHPQVKRGMDLLVEHQSGDGLWENSYRKGAKKIETEKAQEDRLWVTLAICSVLSRLEK